MTPSARKKKTPSARSKEWLEQRGFIVGSVEKWIPQARRRVDLYGFGDLLSFHPSLPGVLLVQVTVNDGKAHDRLRKIAAEPRATEFLRCEHRRVQVHAWALRGGKGKRKTYRLRRWFVFLGCGGVTSWVELEEAELFGGEQ